MKAFRVLVIDDGKEVADLSHHLKMRYGAEVFVATRLEDGLKMRQELAHLDYIVLDLSLPDSKSREDTIKCIPALRGIENIPVFVFTGYEEAELLQTSIDHGATDWFLKGDNHRGGSTLAARMGTNFIRDHMREMEAPQKKKISTSIVETRKAQAEPARNNWITIANAVAGLAVVGVTNILLLIVFIYNQGAANALFRKQVADNTGGLGLVQTEVRELHDKANESKQNRLTIEARQTAFDNRLNVTDGKLDSIRSEMNAGFTSIYNLLVKQQQTPAGK
jgi:CheY-like chemotaxis protein